ncbi:MAG: dTDP-glucose 4,6-dehydratase [Alphaproteobacteria bacterium]|nr:dTDP-glucose 4,6-dehydratase [Alphaproteobacteria bacterium]
MSENHSILLTGGAGFIGSSMVAACVAAGHHVVVLDKLTYAGSRANLEWIRGNWQLVVGDIGDQSLVLRLLSEHRVRWVVNMAAESHVDNSISGPRDFMDTNILGTFSLLEACRAYQPQAPEGFRVLQVSTDEVYGSLGATGAFSETSPMRPNSPYSASKAAADHLARAWFETYGLPCLITHCTNNYGPRQHPEKLIPRMIDSALAGKPLPVYGDGLNVRDWIHVSDHCRGLLLALKQGKTGEVYDFGGRAEAQNITMVKQLCVLLDKLCPRADKVSYAQQITFVADRPGHDRRYAIDDSKAQRELGYLPQMTLESGLEATVRWYLDNRAWVDAIRRAA